eukprot:5238310-Pleurochrysis_carterae.AAC.1
MLERRPDGGCSVGVLSGVDITTASARQKGSAQNAGTADPVVGERPVKVRREDTPCCKAQREQEIESGDVTMRNNTRTRVERSGARERRAIVREFSHVRPCCVQGCGCSCLRAWAKIGADTLACSGTWLARRQCARGARRGGEGL